MYYQEASVCIKPTTKELEFIITEAIKQSEEASRQQAEAEAKNKLYVKSISDKASEQLYVKSISDKSISDKASEQIMDNTYRKDVNNILTKHEDNRSQNNEENTLLNVSSIEENIEYKYRTITRPAPIVKHEYNIIRYNKKDKPNTILEPINQQATFKTEIKINNNPDINNPDINKKHNAIQKQEQQIDKQEVNNNNNSDVVPKTKYTVDTLSPAEFTCVGLKKQVLQEIQQFIWGCKKTIPEYRIVTAKVIANASKNTKCRLPVIAIDEELEKMIAHFIAIKSYLTMEINKYVNKIKFAYQESNTKRKYKDFIKKHACTLSFMLTIVSNALNNHDGINQKIIATIPKHAKYKFSLSKIKEQLEQELSEEMSKLQNQLDTPKQHSSAQSTPQQPPLKRISPYASPRTGVLNNNKKTISTDQKQDQYKLKIINFFNNQPKEVIFDILNFFGLTLNDIETIEFIIES